MGYGIRSYMTKPLKPDALLLKTFEIMEFPLLMDRPPYARAFEHSSVGMAFLTDDGTIAAANPALSAMVKRAPALVVGRPFADYLTPDARRLWTDFFDQFRAGGEPHDEFESAYLPSDGHEAWWSLRLSDLGAPGEGDQDRRFFAVIRDETARKGGRTEAA